MTRPRNLLRAHHPDTLTPDQRSRMCPSCRMRYKLTPPATRDSYGPWSVEPRTFEWIENAARDFDDQAGEDRFTAADFIAWIRPDCVRGRDAA